MLKKIRPVGNHVPYNPIPFDQTSLHPYSFTGFQSGTASLAAAIIAAKRQLTHIKQPEVIIPAYCCPDILSACEYAKVKVRIVDLEKNRPWLCLSQIEKNITDNTIAIVAINFLGISERINEIRQLLGNKQVIIIEDSAQNFSIDTANSSNNSSSNYSNNSWTGDLIVLSFGRGKPISLFGGGAVITKRLDLQKLLPKPHENTDTINFRLKSIIFKIISSPFIYYWLVKLPFLNIGATQYKTLSIIKKIQKDAKLQLQGAIKNFNLITENLIKKSHQYYKVKNQHIINLPSKINQIDSNPLLRYPILITEKSERERIYHLLESKGLGVSKMYQKAILEIENIPTELIINKPEIENAKQFASQLITLPCHLDVENTDIKRIINICNQ